MTGDVSFQHLQQLNFKCELMLGLNRLIADCCRRTDESAHHLDAAFACRDLSRKVHDVSVPEAPRYLSAYREEAAQATIVCVRFRTLELMRGVMVSLLPAVLHTASLRTAGP